MQQVASDEAELAGELQPAGNFLAHLAAFNIDGIRHELTGKCLENGLGYIGTGAVLGLNCGGSQVRRHGNLRKLKQRGIRAWLSGIDVKASTAVVTGLDGLRQGRLIDKPAACGVDDDLPLLGLRQKLSIKHSCGLRSLGEVNGHKIRARHELLKADQLHA